MEQTASFGYWVRRRRKALDMTQEQLARRVACAVDTIKKIESDTRRPSKQLAQLLAEQLDVPIEEREAFIRTARGERTADRLPNSAHPPSVALPTGTAPPEFLAPLSAAHPEPPSLFVGRAEELAVLNAYFTAALNQHGRVVFVTGEAGSGKTALMSEFGRRARTLHPDVLVASGNCNAFVGVGDPYLPFRDVMSMLSGDVESRWVAGAISQAHARQIWNALPDVGQAVAENGPQLLDFLISGSGLVQRLETSVSGTPDWLFKLKSQVAHRSSLVQDQQQTRLFEGYANVLNALSIRHPLIILLDDLQWADDGTLGLLFHLGRRLTSSRILIVGAYRPSDLTLGAPVSGVHKEHSHPLKSLVNEFIRQFGEIHIDLGRTTTRSGREFVDALLDAEPNNLNESFRAGLYERTRGHPLFTVELLRDMQARGDLILDQAGRRSPRPGLNWETLPARVEAVIEQRIDRLDPELRELLTTASVEGEGFSVQVLSRVTGKPEPMVLRLLSQELEQRHKLVRARDEVMVGSERLARYWFGHVLFQQYLYQRLAPAERRWLHLQVGNALESLCSAGLDSVAVLLARHFDQAGEPARAIPYLLQAGDRARNQYAYQEAAQHYERALQLLRSGSQDELTAQTLMKLGHTYSIGFDLARARQAYQQGFALWKQVDARRSRPALAPAPHPLRMMWREPKSLDPTMGGTNTTAPITMYLFSGLVAHSPEMEVLPDVAHSWDILEGGSKYIFHLREDVFWSDGTPVTAGDFEFTFKRALDPATQTPVAGLLLYGIKGARDFHLGQVPNSDCVAISAPDDATLIIELEEPTSYFIQDLSYYVLLPIPRHMVERHGPAWAERENIVTNGPFRLISWQHNESMLLERNPTYHGRHHGNVTQVYLNLRASIPEHFELYEQDKLDVVLNWFYSSPEMDELKRRHSAEYVRRLRFQPTYLVMNLKHPLMHDVRLRRALALSINKNHLIEVANKGYDLPASGGFIPPGMPGYSEGIGLPFDPQRARRLLSDAGYKDGVNSPVINCFALSSRAAILTFLQEQWREQLGIQVNVELLEPLKFWARVKQEPAAILAGGWWADYADPDNYLRVDVQLDAPDWHHPEYEKLLEQSRQITDQEARLKLYRAADRILMDEAIIVPLIYVQTHLLLKPWVKQYPIGAIKGLGFWNDVIIEPH